MMNVKERLRVGSLGTGGLLMCLGMAGMGFGAVARYAPLPPEPGPTVKQVRYLDNILSEARHAQADYARAFGADAAMQDFDSTMHTLAGRRESLVESQAYRSDTRTMDGIVAQEKESGKNMMRVGATMMPSGMALAGIGIALSIAEDRKKRRCR